ncbi:RagB/SusD family nutrient uptake outer membrane protein [Dysgonomonas sp. 521]|uniref:RagB/SusD family nutrient uptake outer membrane protein n=1 Tax=Dysgonomonas sp. 521 TaxID=2302932 RepID=UPI0013D25516|nr:RagB/SusD family nutrient uptake outer membrane protein [Dysgonomonas sp. 521]
MKKIIYSLAIIASVLTLNSCLSDLDTLPLNETDKTAEQAYDGTLESYEKGLAYIYASFSLVSQNDPGGSDISVPDAGQSDLMRQYMILNEASTDALKCIWGDSYMTGIQYNTWTAANNEAIIAVYTRCMVTVTRVNEFLKQTSGGNVDGIAGLRAEARLMRAFAYYLLIDLYGNPPFATEDNVGGAVPTQIGRTALFEWIETELTELLASDSGLSDVGVVAYPRVNKGVAQALLTRLYLNAEVYTGTARWEDTRDAAAKTIAMGYKLCSNYEELFMQDNGENSNARQELIFTIAYDRDHTQSWGGTTHLVSGSMYDNASQAVAEQLGLPTGTMLNRERWNGYHVSNEYVENFELEGVDWNATTGLGFDRSKSDKRAFVYNVGHSKEFDITTTQSGWVCWKYNSRASDGTVYSNDTYEKFSSIDFPVIRLAEMYMAYAEAVTRLAGGTTTDATAMGYVKALRDRAGVSMPSSLNLDFLLQERAREFMWEGQRRTDLIRYGYFTSMSFPWPYKGNIPDGKVALPSWRTIYPIIQSEITENPNLVQNPGY